MTCLDSSSDGMCIYYHYVILSSYLALGHIPKLIIYDTNDFYSIHLSASTFTLETALDRLALYYGEYLDIDFLYLEQLSREDKDAITSYRYDSKQV